MKNLFYYSTNTYIAYNIANIYYNKTHFVWCSPIFNPARLGELDPWKNIPPSSSPFAIYNELKNAIQNDDTHNSKIRENKLGISNGANITLANGGIDANEHATILQMIEHSKLNHFRPLLFLINAEMVKDRIEQVPVAERANPLGIEYRIKDLKEYEFEIIEF